MRRSARSSRPAARGLVVTTFAALLAAAATAAPAHASPTAGTPAVVAMGDSYISGEAGRWEGNSISPTPGHDGTDRAPTGDTSSVYVGGSDTGADTCHRSDVSEVAGATVPAGVERIDISCSGAVTSDLLTTAEGGTSDHTEAPEGDQLARVAADHRVTAIVVSIGGNDFGFASVVEACLQAYETGAAPCQTTQEPMLRSRAATVRADIEGVVASIRGVMGAAGYTQGSYRLILQSYAVVAAPGSRLRYPEDPLPLRAAGDRTVRGCPTYTSDADWFSQTAAPIIGGAVDDAARDTGTEFLDLSGAFVGHETCSVDTRAVTASDPPSETGSEWGRAGSAASIAQGSVQEIVHPNAFGQRALSTCLSGVLAGTPGRFACTGRARIAPTQLDLRQTEAFPAATPDPGTTTPTTSATAPATTPAAPPAATAPTPPAGGQTAAPTATAPGRCSSRRRLTLTVPRRYRSRVRSGRVLVAGRRVATVSPRTGRARVSLVGRSRGTLRVRIELRLRDGRRVTDVRTYHPCTARRS